MKKIIRHFWSPSLLLFCVIWLDTSHGSIPSLGKLLSPFHGFLQNTERVLSDKKTNLKLPSLEGQVEVLYDSLGVPHIFAQNDHDLFLAQGYVMAQHRLWQMEFYTLVAAGRLTEIIGGTALEIDRYHRKIGLARTAKRINERLSQYPEAQKALEAYAQGVNAYISQTSFKHLPIEYKLLGYEPEYWSSYSTLLMLMNMRRELNEGSWDFKLSKSIQRLGIEAIGDLFPNYPSQESPIIPLETKFDFLPVAVSGSHQPVTSEADVGSFAKSPHPEIGSNNWVLSGSKTYSGLPILANDPHLNLSFPSIWFQVQLHSPNYNVCGVCLPGCPGVIIGFNEDIAWGLTNVGSDIMDFYNIKYKNAKKDKYLFEGKWLPVKVEIEKFKLKGGEVLTDTVRYTHHGPIVYEKQNAKKFKKDIPSDHAIRWVALEIEGSDMMAFLDLNKAQNYDDYRKALSYYTAPAQNFVFADRHNNISITVNGRLPLKTKEQGKFILDGSLKDSDWKGWIPREHLPTAKNPARGFLSSANQFSAGVTYPYYLGWCFSAAYRGLRINERLEAMQAATVDSVRKLQNDNFSMKAKRIFPIMLNELDSKKARPFIQTLKSWDYIYGSHSEAAAIFEIWTSLLYKNIWNDELPEYESYLWPTEDRTWFMIEKQKSAPWFDNIHTPNKEAFRDILNASFDQTIDSLTQRMGVYKKGNWNWGKVKDTRISHLVPNFKSFSRYHLDVGGGKGIVNALSTNNGPSWRMVIAFEKDGVKGFGVYPGGQSGNPGSRNYANMLPFWVKGELIPLVFLKNSKDLHPAIRYKVFIQPQ